MEAAILHADLDAFYASVEQRDDPALRGKPVIVGAGVVLSASYEARARGVRTAMGGRRARALCPDAIVVSPRMSAYSEASRAVFAVFEESSPVVEAMSIDEAFLDGHGLAHIRGTPPQMAARLRAEVREHCGLPLTVSVARTKFLAKVASGVAKPDGLLVVPPDRELEFLHPLPIEALWGVGAVTAEKLRRRRILTVGDVASLERDALIAMLGAGQGRQLYALARNRDPRRVQPRKRRRSIGSQCAIGMRYRTPIEIDGILLGLVERVTGRMRKADRAGRTVTLRLRFHDFGRATRSRTFTRPTAETQAILAVVRDLMADAGPLIDERGLTLVGIAVSNFERGAQLEIPFAPDRLDALDTVVDDVRRKFGTQSLTRAVLLGRDTGLVVPLLPD